MEENILISDLILKLQSMKEKYGDLPIATIGINRIITNTTNYANKIRMSAVITDDHKDDHLLLIIE